MEQTLYTAMRDQQTPEGRKFWTFNAADRQFRWHDKTAGTVTVYNQGAFEIFCIDLIETITGARPNQIPTDLIDGLRVKFRNITFGGC